MTNLFFLVSSRNFWFRQDLTSYVIDWNYFDKSTSLYLMNNNITVPITYTFLFLTKSDLTKCYLLPETVSRCSCQSNWWNNSSKEYLRIATIYIMHWYQRKFKLIVENYLLLFSMNSMINRAMTRKLIANHIISTHQ